MPDPTTTCLEHRFESLVGEYGPALRRLSRAYLRDPFEQQDLFQEIALALWTALPRYFPVKK